MQLEVGKIVEGKVTGITNFGAFIDLGDGVTGMVHISEVASTYVKEIRDHLTENQIVKVKIVNVTDDGKVSLSIKKAVEGDAPQRNSRNRSQGGNRGQGGRAPRGNVNESRDFSRRNEPESFEDMLSKFKQNSEEKMSDLKHMLDNKRGSRRYGGK